MKAATAILCLFASHIGAQTTPDSYRVGSGISYDYYGKTGFAALLDVDARIAPSSNVFYHLTMEMTPQQATLRPGAEYEFYNSGNWSIGLFGDAGLATGTGATLGSLSGGGKLGYNIGRRVSNGLSSYYVTFACKVLYTAGQPSTTLPVTPVGVLPVFSILFSKGF